MHWVVFSYSLPAKAVSSPRVTVWRRLRRLGAISPAGSVQVLPARDDCVEAFQWLAQEIRQAKGEAVVMRVEQFEGLTNQQLIDLFHAARAEDYQEIEGQLMDLEKALGRRLPADKRSAHQETLGRLQRRHAEIARIDYFNCPAGRQVASRLAKIEETLSPRTPPAPQIESHAIEAYQGKCWVTRPHPHVDRLACAWLIRRFIDPAAVIHYAAQPQPDEVTFDYDTTESRFGHVGNLCTFEVMCSAFNLDDPALRIMAEIVHVIDLQDGRYARAEIAGIEAILDGWQQTAWPDADREAHGIAFFEGLYQSLQDGVKNGSAAINRTMTTKPKKRR